MLKSYSLPTRFEPPKLVGTEMGASASNRVYRNAVPLKRVSLSPSIPLNGLKDSVNDGMIMLDASGASTNPVFTQALADAKPDAIFSSLFGADLAKFVREGQTRGLFKGVEVFNLLAGEPEYLDPLKEEAPEGWYVTGYDPAKEDTRHFRLDRIKQATITDRAYELRHDLDPIADIEGWPRTGEVGGSRTARVWISAEQARWAREERTVAAEFEDGSIVVEWTYKGEGYLVKEVLKEAGDAVILEPADLRAAVLTAAERLLDAQ